MSWGTIVNGLFLSHIRPSELKDRLEENNRLIDSFKSELIAMSAFTGETFTDGDRVVWSWCDHVAMRVQELLDELQGLYNQNMLISYAIDNPDAISLDE